MRIELKNTNQLKVFLKATVNRQNDDVLVLEFQFNPMLPKIRILEFTRLKSLHGAVFYIETNRPGAEARMELLPDNPKEEILLGGPHFLRYNPENPNDADFNLVILAKSFWTGVRETKFL